MRRQTGIEDGEDVVDMGQLFKANVYIDESGDLGYKKGSDWFCISAVIVKEENEQIIRQKLRKIKENLNVSFIHFVKIHEFNRRSYVVNELNNEDFVIIAVVSDTRELEIARKNTLFAYNYLSRLLIERISWYLRDNNLVGDITFSARSSKKDEQLVGYIIDVVRNKPESISSENINKICYKKASEWDMLQLADVCASSIYQAHQKDQYGFRYPCFINKLFDHLYSYDKRIANYGVKYFPETSNTSELKISNVPCRK